MKYDGKVVVVTGAGGGIGRQLVLQLLEKGASVAAVDINEKALAATKEAAGSQADRVSLHIVDITDKDAVCALAGEVTAVMGKVDGIINNAGIIQPFIPFADLDYETMQRIININLYGMMFMTRAFIPHLAESSEAFIINVSSMGGFIPVPGQTLYGASKAAVKLLTEGLRAELSKTHIQVSVVFPGGINTDIVKNSGVELTIEAPEENKAAAKLTTPQEAAAIILKGVEKGKARIVVGKDARFLDLFSRLAPLKAGKFISNMMAGSHSGSFNTVEDLSEKKCLSNKK